MRALHLTTPLQHGDDVKVLQRQLAAWGWFKGKVDGVYGTLTAQAVYRAKFWLGYAKPDHVAGDSLDSYLAEKAKPTPAMLARTRARKAAQPKKPLRVAALAFLVSKLGQKESPAGSNRVAWASTWYGVIGPWCAMAVTRAYVEAGSKAFAKGKRYAYVPFIVADARAGRNHLTVTHDPQPGDLACYDWNRDGVADHVGLFEKWIVKGKTFQAVEGNTAVGNDSNGGEVMRRPTNRADQPRSVSNVQVFVRVGG